MRRLAVLALTFASFAFGDTVFVTAHGKTYHTDRSCMSLAKSTHVMQTDSKTAVQHGLHECGICAHRHAKTAKSNNTAWAAEVAK